MADNCRQIAGGPAETFWQALQLFNFATTLTQIEGNGHSISYGRMDQWLYPYYEADMKAGRITRERALELIESALCQNEQSNKAQGRRHCESASGQGIWRRVPDNRRS